MSCSSQPSIYLPTGPLICDLGDGRPRDLATQALVMGILNRTTDSFFDNGAYYEMDRFLGRAEELVAAGADLLDVGGVKAGIGPEVSLAEELDRVVGAVAELARRFELPISVDTWRSQVAEAAFAAGASIGNDISGFSDPRYLEVAAKAGAAVVATHIRLQPRVLDPEPSYDDVSATVLAYLAERAGRARSAGIPAERIILDPGLDLGKSTAHSLTLLRRSSEFAALGYPLFLAASNKDFLGELFGLGVGDRREPTLAAVALGVVGGCRIVRVHDVLGARRVVDTLAVILGQR